MAKGNLRRLIIVGFLAALAVAALVFPTINVEAGALKFRRGGTGPLGLRLGLDLQGGAHLVYQAVRPPNSLRVTFAEGVEVKAERVTSVLQPVLSRQGRTLDSAAERGVRSFVVQVPCLKPGGRTGQVSALQGADLATLERALREQIGPLTEPARITGGCETPTSAQMEGVAGIIERRINEFGVTEPSVQVLGNDRILVQLPGVGDTEIRATFEGPVAVEAVRGALAQFDRGNARIPQKESASFTIQAPSLKPARRDAQGNVVEPAEQDRIKEALGKVAPLKSFTVGGGIEEAKRLIGQTAHLVFKHRACKNGPCTQYEDIDIKLEGDDLARAFGDRHQTTGLPIVSIEFNSEGGRIFGELTSRIAQPHDGIFDRIAIFLDEEELLAPVARQAILGGRAFIEGPDFTSERVRTLAIQLESGRLPIPVTVLEERDVDATLGADALSKSLVAGYIGLGAVFLFMLLYYRVLGLMAGGALVVYTALALAIFKLFPVTLTLAGVAGFILSVGMAVDANVLIAERTKEELRRGRSLLSAIELGFSRAWPSIRDSNVSTFITCLILWWFGTRLGASLVVGFAITLFLGVAVSMFSAIFVTRGFLLLALVTPLRRATNLFTPVPGQALEAPARPPFRRS